MICPECREGDHPHCYDTQHPHQDYRGCACQHGSAHDLQDKVDSPSAEN